MGKEPKVDDFIEEKLEEINDEIERINNSKVIRAAENLLAKRDRLMAARRALLGAGNKVTGSGGNRVTQAEVVAFFKSEDPSVSHSVNYIAEQMGHDPNVIRGHLNRGKDERFIQHEDKTWSLRDPKSEPEEDDDE